ncbi:non-ribosomal peptide synthetase [Saccharothrix hoggarensis]|uniref:Amino acid adenylation domain-containing protein n=1 Tax=Saccharothrix hoggarensis TaxID=913853 RepID=A0ABW3R344_9PSEU
MAGDVVIPASSAQKRFRLLHELADHPGALTLPVAFELHGDVDVDRLDAAVAAVVARHEALRTTFEEVDGLLHQRIADRRAGLEYLDLCDERGIDLDAAVRVFLEDNDTRPFDLVAGPVFGVRLVRLEPRRWLFLLAAHHIAVDAWSLHVVLREIGERYAEPDAAPAARQYREAVAEEERWGRTAEADAEVAHWRDVLAGAPEPVPLPGSPRRPPRRTYVIDQVPIPVDGRVAAALDEVAVRSRASRFAVLLAALARFWERTTGSGDLVVGTPAGGRASRADETVVGPMINTVLLRPRTDAAVPFDEAVRRARDVTFDALDHGRAPFDRVVSALAPRRDPSHSPLCQVMLITQRGLAGSLSLPGVEVRFLPRPAQRTSDLDLTFIVDVEAAGADAVLEYATDLYSEAEAADIARGFADVLAESLLTDTPADVPAGFPPTSDVRGGPRHRHEEPIGPAAVAALRNLAGDASPLAVALAAVDVLLARHDGGSDAEVGALLDGVPPRAVRPRLDDDPTFRDAVGRPLAALADAHRGAGFGVAITTEAGCARDDADVVVALVLDDRPRFEWTYDADRFDPAAVEGPAARLTVLLGSLLAAPDRPVSEANLLPAAEREAVLRAARGPVVPIPEGGVVPMIAPAAARNPDRPAVRCGTETLTYRELDAAADDLAGRLVAGQVGPGEVVGLCLDRSASAVVAILAILRAGAVYAPLDPDLPAARMARLVANAGIRFAVTSADLWDRVPTPVAVLVDSTEAPAAALPTATPAAAPPTATPVAAPPTAAPPTATPAPDDLAYVIHTSGSTGEPKGVAVEHRNLANLVVPLIAHIGLTGDDVVLAAARFSFDMSIFELFAPLVAGACLVLAETGVAGDPDRLRALIETSGATVMQATPSSWQNLLDAGWPGSPALRALCGGEPLTDALAARLAARVGTLWNIYGPTETTVWSTCDRVDPADPVVTIGVPLANTSCYVVDGRSRPVPPGVTGELCVAGGGVARGYLGRPELTAERFAEDVVGGAGRWYRTGDLARLRPDGRFELLGRMDRQVKLRGYRIELGEVEAVLGRHPGVRQVAVVVAGDDPARRHLAAYVVGDADHGELRAAAAEHLPSYMVPSRFFTLDAMPLSPNGKLDHAALKSPQWTVRGPSGPLPRTETERRVAEVWREVLGVPDVRLTDDFLDLGGHSLSATMLMARLNELFAVRLPMRAPFEASTPAGLVALIHATTEESRTA